VGFSISRNAEPSGQAPSASLRFGDEHEAQRLVVHQQRVGQHVVGAERVAVEAARVARGSFEAAAVDDQAAANFAQALAAQRAHQAPERFQVELRIAAAFQHQVADEHAVGERARRVGLGLPAIGGPELLQRRIGGHQLHHRSRVHRRGRVRAQHFVMHAQFLHHYRDAGGGDFRCRERLVDAGGQRALCLGGERESAQQQDGRESEEAEVHRGRFY
jgi:hypothetical protein